MLSIDAPNGSRKPPSWCGNLIEWFGSGAVRQEHVKVMIGEMMTVSALLSGFAIGMSSKVTDDAIRSYAQFLKAEFFGKNSHFCVFDTVAGLPSATPIKDGWSAYAESPMPPDWRGDTCSADGCWLGHWATNHASEELGFPVCTLTADEVKANYPDFWEKMIEDKVANVHLELGHNTMFIIMTTVCVAFVGSLLRLSILKRVDIPKAWLSRFYPIIIVLACLPLVNFYNFLNLANRVIRVIFYYCDDYVSQHCYVSGTPGWQNLIHALTGAAALIWIMHLSLPATSESTSGGDSARSLDGSARTRPAVTDELEKLTSLYERGALSASEFQLAKQEILQPAVGGSNGSPSHKMSMGSAAAGKRMDTNTTLLGGADI